MTVRVAINRLQQINSTVHHVVHAPLLEEYPESLATMALPLVITLPESGQFQGRNGDNQATDRYVVRAFFEALGQSDLGSKLDYGVEVYDAFRTKYLDPETFQAQNADGTYQASQMMVLQYEPYRIEIQQPFTTTGLTIFEYPVNSGFWWHGFEIRFGITEVWDWSC